VRLGGSTFLQDYDWPDSNDTRTFTLPEQTCRVSPLQRTDYVEWGQDESLCRDEIWTTIIARCDLEPNDRDVKVTVTHVVYEEDDCGDEDLDGRQVFQFGVVNGGASASKTFTTRSDEDGDDFSRVTLNVTNEDGPAFNVDPNTARVRGVLLQGEVDIEDVEFGPTDSEERTQLWRLFVDFDIHNSPVTEIKRFCVGDEVIVEAHIECWDNTDTACDLTYFLWEGDDCTVDTGDDSLDSTVKILMPKASPQGLGSGISELKRFNMQSALERAAAVNFKLNAWKVY
jgi:hypothetical protein